MTVNHNPHFAQFTLWTDVNSGVPGLLFALCAERHCNLSIADLLLWKGC